MKEQKEVAQHHHHSVGTHMKRLGMISACAYVFKGMCCHLLAAHWEKHSRRFAAAFNQIQHTDGDLDPPPAICETCALSSIFRCVFQWRHRGQ